ncbi:MAG: alanine racemase [Legionellaceae bacterium]|nr:alanine racemase [Legionellaceae bacterium]
MSTYIDVHLPSLMHNLALVRRLAPNSACVAMVKADAYGCGVQKIAPQLEGNVDALGVARIEEALQLRRMGITTPIVVFQGVLHSNQWPLFAEHQCAVVLHHADQLRSFLNSPLSRAISVWVKVNTGMHRLGFSADEVLEVVEILQSCPWVAKPIKILTHFACADEPENALNQKQIENFEALKFPRENIEYSMANSAAILAFPESHADWVRPGIMLYGVSPFADRSAQSLGLRPVMCLSAEISALQTCAVGDTVGYGATWQAKRVSRIGVVQIGYGDGYPRHVAPGTPVWIHGQEIPIVGRISMDSLTIDLTDYPHVGLYDRVELWGPHLAVERIAKMANTSPYELLCQVISRKDGRS